MAASSSITLAQTCEWAKKFVFRRPLALGNYLEPAVSSANTILQTIIGPPFAWRWNRAVIGFICNPGQQDYTIFNWTASTAIPIGYCLVDSNGYSQQVTTAGTTGATIPSFNSTVSGTTVDGTVTWTNLGLIGVSNTTSTYSFNWIENASVQDTNPTTGSKEWKEMYSKIDLALDSAKTLPKFISAQFDDGKGNITFRLMPTPVNSYPVTIVIQQKPPVINSLENTWSPIPDEYSRLYNWGFLSLMFMFADDARFQYANQKFIANLLSTAQGLSQTELNIVLNNWQQITGAPVSKADSLQQGFQGRAAL